MRICEGKTWDDWTHTQTRLKWSVTGRYSLRPNGVIRSLINISSQLLSSLTVKCKHTNPACIDQTWVKEHQLGSALNADHLGRIEHPLISLPHFFCPFRTSPLSPTPQVRVTRLNGISFNAPFGCCHGNPDNNSMPSYMWLCVCWLSLRHHGSEKQEAIVRSPREWHWHLLLQDALSALL